MEIQENDFSRMSTSGSEESCTLAVSKNSSEDFLKMENEKTGILEVYEDNFVSTIKILGILCEKYNYVGMDTEFPGTVFSIKKLTEDFYYKSVKLNVDSLKMIQLGITLKNEKGEFPDDYPYHTFQFNFKFDPNKDKYSKSSMDLLVNSGIDFEKLKTKGIKHKTFAEYFIISGLVLNPNVHWISFHGSYDFAYLLRLLSNMALPSDENEFTKLLSLYFPNHYDIRILVKGKSDLKGGLNKLADYFKILREGKKHQAGSDSLVTIDVFNKLIKTGIINQEQLKTLKNVLFGLGSGKDNEETIKYTPIEIVNNRNVCNNQFYKYIPVNNVLTYNCFYPQIILNGIYNRNNPNIFLTNMANKQLVQFC